MASSPLELDDQTDEDFFDKLVDDDLDFAGSPPPSAVEASAIAAAGLTISGVDEPQRVESVVPEDSSFRVGEGLGEKANLDSLDSLVASAESKSGGDSDSGSGKVKVVQWDSFGSDLASKNLCGSFSDLFGGLGDSSDDPFANVGNGDSLEVPASVDYVALGKSSAGDLDSSTYEATQGDQQSDVNAQDLSSSQHWENAYPGWKFDPASGQWYEIEGYDANASSNGVANSSTNLQESSSNANALDQKSDSVYSDQTAATTVATGNASGWNQVSQGGTGYPAHMVFDPQYPEWYYDTISQEWKSLDSYNPTVGDAKGADGSQQHVNMNVSSYGLQNNVNHQDGVANLESSLGDSSQQNASVWQSQQTAQSVTIGYSGSQKLANQYLAGNNYASLQTGLSRGLDGGFGVADGFLNLDNSGQYAQYHDQIKESKPQEAHFLPAQFNSQSTAMFSHQPQQSLSSGTFSYAGSEERKSSERPPHALVTFGFGGKLLVMRDASSLYTSSAYGSQASQGGVINVLNLMEVVTEKNDASGFQTGGRDYFNALGQQSFPGPLVGGNPGSKELNKWIDNKIASYETSYMDFGKGDLLRLLFSLLKIAVQYYGKLRSPFGSDQALKDNSGPESAVANLFASAKRNQEYGNITHCLQSIPSEAHIQATAHEVQKLLVSGRKKEALEIAQEGQLWGPALVLASQLGDQFYGDTVKKMALKQLIAGSPLRTLCLLIAGQPADVFSDTTTSQSSVPNSVQMFQPTQVQGNSTMDQWTQNLAVITANRTKDDELVIIHLGDCLWKETGEITAAHICYLVAEANFEQHSNTARLCLIGADHWKFPRTYASPAAIQMTELYEYAKVLGNSQFLLLPFQPYKLVYAHMLAEVGKISESLKYCQALLKSLKTGRAPELEAWKQLVLSLEERIKTHQQGGYGSNLASTKLVGKLLTFFDSTAHRVVGGLPPPVPSTTQGSSQYTDSTQQLGVPRVLSAQSAIGQSTMMSPFLMPSASMEPISANGNDDVTVPNRSISEPNLIRNPQKVDSSVKETSSNTQERTLAPSSSRIGRFGSQIFQKTVGLVIKSRSDKQAKLGEANSFYYDEKLKRWVERGAEPPPEQEALPPPPPTNMAFQRGTQDYSIQGSSELDRRKSLSAPDMSPNTSENSLGIPPIPSGSNQYSGRSRMGVRSRYVDTFNKGGGNSASSNLFHSPPTLAAKPVGGSFNPKFFVPSPVMSEQTAETGGESSQEDTIATNHSSASLKDDSTSSMERVPMIASTTPPPLAMQRFASMDTIVDRTGDIAARGNISLSSQSRRINSWSGSLSDARSPIMTAEIKPLGKSIGVYQPMHMPNNPPQHLRRSSGSFGDDLQEVQL